MQIIHPLDALRYAVIAAGGEIILPSPFRTRSGATVNKIIFRQNGDVNRPVVPGSLVFAGTDPHAEPGLFAGEILLSDMDELKTLRDAVCVKPTLTSRLDGISAYAFAAVKDALRKLGGSFVLENGIPLVVDTCTDSGFVYHFEAKKVKLIEGRRILILKEMDGESERHITEGGYCEPDECFWEGSDWYAEWEGLLEVFDAVIEAAENL